MRKKQVAWAVTMFFGLLAFSDFCFAAEKKIVLRYQTTETAPTTVEAFNQIVKDWNKLHPDVTVQFAGIAWKDQYPKTMTEIAAGIAAEIIHFEPVLSGPFFRYNLFQPMDDLVKEIEASGLHFLPGTKENSNYKGIQFGVPLQIQGNLLWYRTDLFKKAGLSLPETWDDWEKCAKALTTAQIYGTCVPGGRSLFTATLFAQFIVAAGGHLFDDSGKVVIDSPQTAKALKFYGTLAKYSPPGIGGYDFYETYMSFVKEKAAIVPYWGRLLAVTGFENPGLLPATDNMLFPAAMPGGKRLSWNPVEYLTIPKTVTPEQKKAAQEFIKFWMKPENYIRYCHSVFPNITPPIKEIQDNPQYKSHPLYKSHAKAAQRILDNPIWDITYENPKLGFNPIIGVVVGEQVLEDVVQRHIVKGESVESAIKWGQGKIEAIVKSFAK
jgi:multiple sugar transport system substrate-binding protein